MVKVIIMAGTATMLTSVIIKNGLLSGEAEIAIIVKAG